MTQKHNIFNCALAFTLLFAIVLAIVGCTALKVTDYGHEVVRDSDGKPLVDKDGKVQTVAQAGRRDRLEAAQLQGRGLTGVEQGDRNLVQRSGGACREDRSRNRHVRRQHRWRGGSLPPEEGDCKLPLQGRQRGEGEDHLRGRQLHDHRRHDHRNLHGLLRKVT